MSRYEPLAQFLRDCSKPVWEASFAEIEKILGFPLPASAYRHSAWWANQKAKGHSQVTGWAGAGWRKRKVDLARKCVAFERISETRSPKSPDADLLERARACTGILDDKTLISEGLRALIAREAARQLIKLGGTMPDLVVPPRERPAL